MKFIFIRDKDYDKERQWCEEVSGSGLAYWQHNDVQAMLLRLKEVIHQRTGG